MAGRLFTSESVTEGHPDKIADRISDTILDYLMEHDSDKENLRVAVETLLTTGLVVVTGEISTTGSFVRGIMRSIGGVIRPRIQAWLQTAGSDEEFIESVESLARQLEV